MNDLLSIPGQRDFSKSSSSSFSLDTHARWAVLHLPLLASVKSLRKWIAMPNRNIPRRKWIRKRRKTTTYSANLARKHSWHELIREREQATDRPSVSCWARASSHSSLFDLWARGRGDIIYTYDYVVVLQQDSFAFFCLLIKSNWSHWYPASFRSTSLSLRCIQCRAFFWSLLNILSSFVSILTLRKESGSPLMVNWQTKQATPRRTYTSTQICEDAIDEKYLSRRSKLKWAQLVIYGISDRINDRPCCVRDGWQVV